MKPGKGFARGREAQRRSATKKARPKSLVPKNIGARVDKGKLAHLYDAKHIALVKDQACLVSRRLGRQFVAHHHPDELFPHLISQQRKISDFLSVPLAHELHDPGYPGSLHKSNRAAWWTKKGCPPARVYCWLRTFLQRHYKPDHPGRIYALEQIAIVEQRQGIAP